MENRKGGEGMGSKWKVGSGKWERKKGQSTLEYLVVIGLVLAAILGVVATAIKPRVQQTVTDSGDAIQRAANKLKDATP